MKTRINLLLQRINWEYVVLYSFYAFCLLVVATSVSILSSKRQAAEEYCAEKRGIIIQEKNGDLVCIKQKSVIKWETEE